MAYAFVLGKEQVLCLFTSGSQCSRLEVDQGVATEKEVSEMLSLEVIGILGALFALLVYGMVRTQAATRQARAEEKAQRDSPAAVDNVG